MQAGIEAASECDEVWVAALPNEGAYFKGNRTNVAVFDKGENYDRSGIALLGGFTGSVNETRRWQRDRTRTTNKTILDGEEVNAVVRFSGITLPSRVDGFVIRNGVGDPIEENRWCGGGVVALDCSPVVSNNTISCNGTSTSGGGAYCSGGLPIFYGNNVNQNSDPQPIETGGGIDVHDSWAYIAKNEIQENKAGSGGGIYSYQSARLTIRNNVISENKCWDYGGGVCVDGTTAAVLDNTFELNRAGIAGGAIEAEYGSTQITGNVFKENGLPYGPNWPEEERWPDYVDRGGAIALEWGSTHLVANNLFVKNKAKGTGGGAIDGHQCTASVVNNTFVENGAIERDPYEANGGAVLLRGWATSGVLVNNIFYRNVAQGRSVGNSVACVFFATGSVLFCGAYSEISADDAYHYLVAEPGAGCFNHLVETDPPEDSIFVDEGEGDYHLVLPAPEYTPVDQGHDPGGTPYHTVPSADLEGLKRPVDIDTVTNGTGGSSDMGAYEAQE